MVCEFSPQPPCVPPQLLLLMQGLMVTSDEQEQPSSLFTDISAPFPQVLTIQIFPPQEIVCFGQFPFLQVEKALTILFALVESLHVRVVEPEVIFIDLIALLTKSS